MASIYSRINKKKKKKYYCSIYHNGKRIRKFLGNSKELAEASLKKLEYELLFNIQNFYTDLATKKRTHKEVMLLV
ncbi:hypothetical protein EB821_02920 [Candidatus Marinimicrobia bacterium PRS2]|nr:hypothetical protein EB821_02920 [Candidatus Marinimicrobia bacterium PRS2]